MGVGFFSWTLVQKVINICLRLSENIIYNDMEKRNTSEEKETEHFLLESEKDMSSTGKTTQKSVFKMGELEY